MASMETQQIIHALLIAIWIIIVFYYFIILTHKKKKKIIDPQIWIDKTPGNKKCVKCS